MNWQGIHSGNTILISFFCSFLFTFTDYGFDSKFYEIFLLVGSRILWEFPKLLSILIPEQQNDYISETLRMLSQAITIIILANYIYIYPHSLIMDLIQNLLRFQIPKMLS